MMKIWKPSYIQKLLTRLKIIKDRRYNGNKKNRFIADEYGLWPFKQIINKYNEDTNK